MSRVNLAISGPPRNGTSALRRLVNVDPRIMIFHESNFFKMWDDKVYGANDFKLNLNLRKELPEYSGIMADKGLDFDKFFETLKKNGPFTGDQVLDYLYNNTSATVVGDKNPVSYVNDMNTVLSRPNSKLVAIVRDGRDAIASYVRHWHTKKDKAHWMKPTVEQAQHVWLNTVRRIWGQTTESILVVSLEKVAAHKKAFMRGLQLYLGLEERNIKDECPHYEPFGPVRVGIWKEEIPDVMSKVNDEFIHYMKLFDYI